MRAQEFTTEKLPAVINEYDADSENSKQIIANLKRLNYSPVGSGHDATVWSKDAGSVIKIIMPHELSRAAGDESFLVFYEFCVAHRASPFLPKFISIGGEDHTVFTLNGVDYRQISMEKLSAIPKDSVMEQLVWGLSDLATVSFIKWPDVKKQLTAAEFWKGFPGPGDESDIIRSFSDQSVEKMYAELFKVMRMLYSYGRSKGQTWDLHTENVMCRGNIPVIIDPFLG